MFVNCVVCGCSFVGWKSLLFVDVGLFVCMLCWALVYGVCLFVRLFV